MRRGHQLWSTDLPGQNSLGARVLSKQIRSVFVPILYHVSLLTVVGKWFIRAATWVFVKEEVKQGVSLNHMLLLPDFVVQSGPAIPMAAKEHKLGQEAFWDTLSMI